MPKLSWVERGIHHTRSEESSRRLCIPITSTILHQLQQQDIQEATRWSLITVAPSPVREVASNSDDDEEKVAIKRLLSFPNCPVEVGESRKASEQSIQLDPSHNTNYVHNTCLVPTYLPCRFLRTCHCRLGRRWWQWQLALWKAQMCILCAWLQEPYVHRNCAVANFAFTSILHSILPWVGHGRYHFLPPLLSHHRCSYRPLEGLGLHL